MPLQPRRVNALSRGSGSTGGGMKRSSSSAAGASSIASDRPPAEPLPRLSALSLLGWSGIGYAAVFVLLTAVGIRLPPLAGWLAIGGFVTSFAILDSQLPRSRPPGDGAVL